MNSASKAEKPLAGSDTRWYWMIIFCLVFLFSILYAYFADITGYQYDPKYYWELAEGVFENGLNPLYILRFPQSIRGYLFPVLLGYCKHLLPGVWGWRILASLSMAFCFSLSLPCAVKGRLTASRKELAGTLLAYAVFMWIWGDLMQYPLSDFFACFFLISAIALLRMIRPGQKAWITLLSGAISGGLLYAAYNTRSTYLYSGILVVAAFFLSKGKNRTAMILTAAGLIAGAAVTALPQCYINRHNEGVFSPKVFYDRVDNEVYKGLTTSKYETYIGDRDVYPRAGIIFDDLTGWQLIQREHITAAGFKLTDIFRLFLRYPLDMTGIYVRHFIALLTPLYRQAYVTDLRAVDPLTIIVSMLLWLTAGYGILASLKEKGTGAEALWIAAVCIPALLQIFDEPELRFFLPVYLLCYYYVFAVIDYGIFFRSLKSNFPQVLIISLVIIGFWISMAGYITATKRDGALLLNETPVITVDKDR